MPIETTINHELRTIIRTVSGPLSAAAIIVAFNASLQDESFSRDMHVIWDLSEADVSSIRSDEMFEVIEHIQIKMDERGSEYKIAIVAPHDLAYGISRMFGAYGSGLPVIINILRSMDEAYDWIQRSDI